ncbi:hypothetical protein JCM19992_13540 [Thermostilla marina]
MKPAVALAAQSAKEPIAQVGYTTTHTSTQLRWLPVRPQSGNKATSAPNLPETKPTASAEEATPAQFVIPNTPENAKPLADPFAEGPALMTEAAPTSQPAPEIESGVPETIPTPEPLPLPGEELDRQAAEEGDDFGPLEEELALGPPPVEDECPSPDNIRPITEITNDITAKGTKFPTECTLQGGTFQPRSWAPITFTWKASGVCHKPLYFEQVAVERYGHNLGPIAQPFASGAHFFLTFPILPYKMGLTPPNECMYPLGYYRPGNCAPWILDPIPLSVRAGLWEAGAWTGAAFAIP